MKNDLNAADLKKMFLFTAQKIVDSEPYLTEIDSVIGDGDHGTGMALGFSYVIKELPQKKCESAEDVVSSVGLILIDTMGGASGVLFGTMFISGIVDREKHETLDLCGFAQIFRKSLDALKKRGKAKVGDKTMIDAFEPAVCGLEEAAAKQW
ncbi:MAG: DAK2 domain-containing protein, partial [Treponema socranskii subsp. buccale]